MKAMLKSILSWIFSLGKNWLFWLFLLLITLPVILDYAFNYFLSTEVTFAFWILGSLGLFINFVLPLSWFQSLFGKTSYNAPKWTKSIFIKDERKRAYSYLSSQRKTIAITLVSMSVIFAGTYFWLNRTIPVVDYVSVSLRNISRTNFYKDSDKKLQRRISPLVITFNKEAAPLDKIGKKITQGISLRPKIKGSWKWGNGRELVFTPELPWPHSRKYKVKLNKKLIVSRYTLSNDEYEFSTVGQRLEAAGSEFFESSEDLEKRNVIFNVSFFYPVDKKSFEEKINLVQNEYVKGGQVKSKKLSFKVIYDDLGYKAFIHSEKVNIPLYEGDVSLSVSEGVLSLESPLSAKASSSQETLTSVQRIPSRSSYFHISSMSINIIDNEKGLPEHVAFIESSTGISKSAMKGNIHFYELPEYKDKKEGYKTNWKKLKYSLNTANIKKDYKEIPYETLEVDGTYPKNHSFRLKVKPGRYVAIIVSKKLKSASNIILEEDAIEIVKIKDFPSKVQLVGKGSVLQLNGEQKLSVFSVNVAKLKIKIGQVLDGQVQHLITQGNGSQKNLSFNNYSFNEKNLAHFSEEIRTIKTKKGSPHYEVINFAPYLKRLLKGKKTRGLFFIEVSSANASGSYYNRATDKRLVLLTDLGVIIKKDKSGIHHVFVQSLSSGKPKQNARVQIISQNGLSLIENKTDREGHVKFPVVNTNNMSGSEIPIGYYISSGDDVSYLKYDDYDRLLNYSRFNVGGRYENSDKNALKAYLFSDRGVYRPGENVKIGHIVKSVSWKKELMGLPIKVEVENSRYKVIHSEKQTLRSSGLGEMSFNLDSSAGTGSYKISLYNTVSYKYRNGRHKKSGVRNDLIGSMTIKVQEFSPDKLKMSTTLFPKKGLGWVGPEGISAKSYLKNLYGLPAASHKVRYRYIIENERLKFSKYSGYVFDTPSESVSNFKSEWFESNTDKEGKSEYSIALDRFSKKVFRLRVIAEGYEKESGRSVLSNDSTLVSPYKFLLGVKKEGDLYYIKRDDKKSVKIVSINSDLNKVKAKGLFLTLKKKKYVNVLTKRNNGTYGYESVKKEEVVSKKEFVVNNSAQELKLDTKNSGDFILTIEDKNEAVFATINYSVIGDSGLSRSLNRSAELQVKFHKTDINAGSNLSFQLKAPYLGSGLMTIERDGVYSYKWFTLTSKTQTLSINVPKGVEGNAYLSINLTRAMYSNEVFMSPFSYGAFPFTVSRKAKEENITIVAPRVAKPGKTFEVSYKSEHSSDIILYAVNEGILQYAKYKNPKPLDFYLIKRSLGTRTWQILDLLLSENSIMRKLLAPGGGHAELLGAMSKGKHLNPFKRKSVKPIAFWSGVVKSSAKNRKWTFDIPGHFNGELRIIAVAANKNRLGDKIARSLIQADLILSSSAPTYLAPGDQFVAPLTALNNITDDDSLSEKEILMSIDVGKSLTTNDALSQKINIVGGSDKTMKVNLTTKDILGSNEILYSASFGKKYSNSIKDTLSVRPASNLITTQKLGVLENDKVIFDTSRKIYKEHAKRSVSLSPTPVSLVTLLESSLLVSPYYCSEQLISKTMPHLLFGRNGKSGDVEAQIQKTVNMILSRQEQSGEILLYPGYHSSIRKSRFISLYSLNFLIEASERGFIVSKKSMNMIASYIKNDFDKIHLLREKSYALYLLTRMDIVTTPFLKKAHNELNLVKDSKQESLSRAYLAATYKLLKDEDSANKLIKEVSFTDDLGGDYGIYYGLSQRDAQLLFLLSKHFPVRAKDIDNEVLKKIFSRISNLNTLNNAFYLLAIDAYKQFFKNVDISKFITVSEKIGNKWKSISKDKLDYNGGEVKYSANATEVKIVSKSDLPLFYTFNLMGFNKEVVKSVSDGLEIFKEIKNEKGDVITEVKQGEVITVDVTFRASGRDLLGDLVLVDLFPGGFELVADDQNKAKGENFKPDFIDAREDRILVYTGATDSMRKLQYKLKATNIGTFALPGALIEDMYNLKIKGLSDQGIIKVLPAN
jgi:uncharacterized protein YfaS (alpha-2-macroglobulin family)